MLYYFLLYKDARKSSFIYIQHLDKNICGFKLWLHSFKHFLAFGEMIIDKFAVWNGKITMKDINFSKQHRSNLNNAISSKKGGIIFTAHIGNLDVARALSKYDYQMKINALVFSKHAPKFNKLLTKVTSKYEIGMICVQEVSPELAINLYDRVQNGEFIVIAADRTSITKPEREVNSVFLGEKAAFPQGAFILASLLKCPAYFMLCPKKNDTFDLIFDNFSLDGITLNKKNRKADLEKYSQQYASLLELYCKLYSLQWFNFFDFWYSGEIR
ncbi:acyltransferase [Francisella halioticida]|nr:acyltransferase [Francisella halioticida]